MGVGKMGLFFNTLLTVSIVGGSLVLLNQDIQSLGLFGICMGMVYVKMTVDQASEK